MVKNRTGEEITVCEYFNNRKQALKMIPDAEILITWGRPVNQGLFNEIDGFNFKWLFSLSVGVDRLPFKELKENGTIVSNIKGVLNTNIAEQAMGIMILFSRQLKRSILNQQNKCWERNMPVNELTGKTLCIIGAGSIGSEIAKRAKAFEMSVIGISLSARPMPGFDAVVDIGQLHTILPEADYIVLMIPLTDKTYHLFGEMEFSLMKKSGIFINLSRGDVTDEQALVNALKERRIAGAGLDVFHQEPLPEDNPLWEMENVVLTPHCAGDSPMVLERAMNLFADSLVLYRQGKDIPNIVDLNRGY